MTEGEGRAPRSAAVFEPPPAGSEAQEKLAGAVDAGPVGLIELRGSRAPVLAEGRIVVLLFALEPRLHAAHTTRAQPRRPARGSPPHRLARGGPSMARARTGARSVPAPRRP